MIEFAQTQGVQFTVLVEDVRCLGIDLLARCEQVGGTNAARKLFVETLIIKSADAKPFRRDQEVSIDAYANLCRELEEESVGCWRRHSRFGSARLHYPKSVEVHAGWFGGKL